MEVLERRLEEVVRLLRDQRKARPRGRSPPRGGHHRVETEDRWDGGSRRVRGHHYSPPFRRENRDSRSQHRAERYSPHSREGPSHHRDGSSWGSRPPNSSRGSPSARRGNRDRKMELPIFSGDDAPGWLLRIERYYTVNGIEGDERMDLVLVALEGRALNWYQTWEDQVLFPTWNQFREAVLRRFQPGVVKDPFGPLLRVRQVGSVMDYIEQFEHISGPMRNVDREIMKGIFVNGLKPELRAEVKSLELGSLAEIKDRALMLEERNKEWRGGGTGPLEKGLSQHKGPNQPKIGPTAGRIWERKEGGGSRPNEMIKGEKGSGTGKRLSQEELQERSRRGLCFKCGERWGQDHICKLKNYKLMLVEGSEEEPLEEEEDSAAEGGARLEIRALQISFHSLKGLTSNRSFKVVGEVGGTEVLVLIDTGATSNFISKVMAKELKLPITKTPKYSVEVGTGQQTSSQGVCKEVVLEVQGVRIKQSFFFA